MNRERNGLILMISLVFTCFVAVTDTHAQSADPVARAGELAAEAASRYEAGDIEGAIESFHEAMTFVPDPAFAFNLAQLYDYLENLPQAHRYYVRYLELYPGAPNREPVETRLGELETTLELAFARLLVTAQQAGVQITVTTTDQHVDYGESPVDVWVPAGQLTITASAAGHEPSVRRMNAVVGVRLEVEIGMLEPHRPPEIEPEANVKRIVGWTLLGVGAVGAGLGGYYWVLAQDSERTHNDLVSRIRSDLPPLTEEDQAFLESKDAETQATIGNVVFGVGVAAILSGTLLLVLDAISSDRTQTESTPRAFFFPEGIGVGWSGRF